MFGQSPIICNNTFFVQWFYIEIKIILIYMIEISIFLKADRCDPQKGNLCLALDIKGVVI